jgi:uncharacterized protein GlcG (DUF336 family)
MKHLKYEDAAEFIRLMFERAQADGGKPLSVSVADARGDLIIFRRMEGATVRSITIAMNKAFTSALMARHTHDWAKLWMEGEKYRYETAWFGIQGLTGIAGGLAISQGDVCVGGIGVAGRWPEEDLELALWAVSANPAYSVGQTAGARARE